MLVLILQKKWLYHMRCNFSGGCMTGFRRSQSKVGMCPYTLGTLCPSDISETKTLISRKRLEIAISFKIHYSGTFDRGKNWYQGQGHLSRRYWTMAYFWFRTGTKWVKLKVAPRRSGDIASVKNKSHKKLFETNLLPQVPCLYLDPFPRHAHFVFFWL